MCNVPKHDSELKRKGNDCKETRVNLLISGNSVRVDYFLENKGEFICLYIGGW